MFKKYLSQYRWIVLSLIFIACICFFLYPSPVLVLNDLRGGNGLILPIQGEEGFTLEYTHSVQKTKVEEHFVFAPNNQLVLTSTNFQSLGVGLPFLPEEGNLVNDNGVFRLTEINREFASITLGFMQLAKQAIIFKDEKYELEDFFTEGRLIEILYEEMSKAEIIWQKWIGGKKVFYG